MLREMRYFMGRTILESSVYIGCTLLAFWIADEKIQEHLQPEQDITGRIESIAPPVYSELHFPGSMTVQVDGKNVLIPAGEWKWDNPGDEVHLHAKDLGGGFYRGHFSD